jgi:hypothetical protein
MVRLSLGCLDVDMDTSGTRVGWELWDDGS